MGLNKCIFEGRLTRDVETVSVGDSSVSKFSLAVDGRPYKGKDGQKKSDPMFIECEAWAKGGEVIAQYFSKGSIIQVEGELRFEQWEDKDNNKRSKHKLRVNEFYFPVGGTGKKDEAGQTEPAADDKPKTSRKKSTKAATAPATPNADINQSSSQFDTEPSGDDGIPF